MALVDIRWTAIQYYKSYPYFCLELFELALAGLGDEKKYLEPLRQNITAGTTPADSILGCFDARKPILSCTAIES